MPLNELKTVSAMIAAFVIVTSALKYFAGLKTWMSLLISFGIVIVVPGIIMTIMIMKMNKDEEKEEEK